MNTYDKLFFTVILFVLWGLMAGVIGYMDGREEGRCDTLWLAQDASADTLSILRAGCKLP